MALKFASCVLQQLTLKNLGCFGGVMFKNKVTSCDLRSTMIAVITVNLPMDSMYLLVINCKYKLKINSTSKIHTAASWQMKVQNIVLHTILWYVLPFYGRPFSKSTWVSSLPPWFSVSTHPYPEHLHRTDQISQQLSTRGHLSPKANNTNSPSLKFPFPSPPSIHFPYLALSNPTPPLASPKFKSS